MSSKGASVRACRVSVRFVAARGLGSLLEPAFISKVEDTTHSVSEATPDPAEDGTLLINESHVFGVKDENTAEVSIGLVARPSKLLKTKKLLGTIPSVKVREALESGIDLEPKWYTIMPKEGGRKGEEWKVLLHIVAARAPPREEISIFVGTWNVGNKAPPDDFSPWLPTGTQHSIVVVGSQECEYPARHSFSNCTDDWVSSLKKHLDASYRLLKVTVRGQMKLAIFILASCQAAVTDVEATSEATGIGHVLANKGAIAVSFKYWDTSFCFVNSHLAAHEGKCSVRNDNYQEIVGNMRPGLKSTDMLNQFHHLVWMGDLNYRLAISKEDADADISSEDEDEMAGRPANGSEGRQGSRGGGGGGMSIPREKSDPKSKKEKKSPAWDGVVSSIYLGNYSQLLDADELIREIRERRAFCGFQEGRINFAPTFKVVRDEVDSYIEKRLPAWCDRILWRSLPGCSLNQLHYSSAPQLLTSDHKPVSASFACETHAVPKNLEAKGGEMWNLNISQMAQMSITLSKSSDSSRGKSGKEEDMRWHVYFQEISGSNLVSADLGGTSDPYLRFVGPGLLKGGQTKAKMKTLSPLWKESDCPILILNEHSPQSIVYEYLLITIWDRDLTNMDDPIGYAVIPLAEAIKNSTKRSFIPFKSEVTLKGLPAGELQGKLKLSWEANKHTKENCAQM